MQTKQIIISILILVFVVVGVGLIMRYQKPSDMTVDETPLQTTDQTPLPDTNTKPITENPTKKTMYTITLETSKGNITFETYNELAPKTVENFVTLAKKGFYDNVIFHRVIKDFMIQGGDPTGTGMGGPGYKFNDELDATSPIAKEGYKRGVVAMANAGPNTNGSQFFIMHKDVPLPYNYTIFGKVTNGMDVVDAIAETAVNGADKPLTDIKILKVEVK